MRTSQLLAAAIAVSSVSASWSENIAYEVKNILYGRGEETRDVLYVRQDNKESSTSNPPANPADKTTASKETGSDAASKTTDGSSKSITVTLASTTKKTRLPSFAADLPAGGISMITPAALAGIPYYKVGDWVTLAWNYTSLSVYPNNIDILATCTKNQATYTLAVNQTVEKTGATVLWDTGAYQNTANVPLLTEMYTLMVYDSESSVSAAPKAGYLGLSNNFQFGLYTKQPYKDWEDGYTCPTCFSAGLSAFEALTLKALLITFGTTTFSLIYFAFSFGVL